MISLALVDAGTVAALTGMATLAIILVVGAAARPGPQSRVPSPPTAAASAVEESSEGRVPSEPRSWVRVASMVLLVAAGGLAAGPIGAAGGVVVLAVRQHRRRVRAAATTERAIALALPDAIELLVLSVHAGRSPTQAILELAQRAPPAVRPGFVAVERQLHRGQALADALAELPQVLGPAARELATGIASADRDGLPLTPTLDRLAVDARTARRRQGEAAAKRLPVRLSFPLVTCVLPAFVLVALAPAVLGALSSLRGVAP